MKEPHVIERMFMCDDYICVVAMMPLGHRCGYVGIPKGHKMYGVDYTSIEEMIDCHGGLTYSGTGKYPLFTDNDYHWFGWDYAHYADRNDEIAYVDNFNRVDRSTFYKFETYGTVTSINEVAEECKSVVKQLEDL